MGKTTLTTRAWLRGLVCSTLGAWSWASIFDLASAPGVTADPRLELPDKPVGELLAPVFGERVDVVAFAATHRAAVAWYQGVLLVNPGRPNLSEHPSVAILEVEQGVVHVEIRPL